MLKPIAIIPAAGYGRRVGRPPAKELLPHPEVKSKSYIEVSIEICEEFHMSPLIISRKDKEVLNQFVLHRLGPSNLVTLSESEEWTDSVNQSGEFWGDKNLLLLPDVSFSPRNVIDQILMALDHNEIVLGIHTIDPATSPLWGVVDKIKGTVREKPTSEETFQSTAWGLMGFRGSKAAKQFWLDYHHSYKEQRAVELPTPFAFMDLDSFVDLTR
jgi:UTP-glucose-1-phosphate uridylyltransferase